MEKTILAKFKIKNGNASGTNNDIMALMGND